MDRVEPAAIRIELVWSPGPRRVEVMTLRLAAPCTIREALHESGLPGLHADVDLARHRVGVWGRLRPLDEPLRDGDRVEIYRALQVDPKEARRRRQRHGQARVEPAD